MDGNLKKRYIQPYSTTYTACADEIIHRVKFTQLEATMT